MDGKAARIDIEPDGIADQGKGYDQQQGNHHREHQAAAPQVGVERLHQRLLIDHFFDAPVIEQAGLDHLERIGGDEVAVKFQVDGDGDRRTFENREEVFAEQALHLLGALLFRDETAFLDIGAFR